MKPGLKPEDIDYFICSNVINEYITPGLSCIIAEMIGLTCPCVDINCACPGFIYAMDIAECHFLAKKVKNVLIENMPEGPQMYPAEQITEERPEETIAELVRGAFLEELDDELPHSLAVVVDSIEYPEDNDSGAAYDGKAHVIVSIYVERDSQKPIIIGRGAEHLVRVKKKLRTPVNRIVGQKAKLDLHVKVAKGWQSDPKQLEKLGF